MHNKAIFMEGFTSSVSISRVSSQSVRSPSVWKTAAPTSTSAWSRTLSDVNAASFSLPFVETSRSPSVAAQISLPSDLAFCVSKSRASVKDNT